MWNIADKDGRFEDRPKRIKAELFPYDNIDIEKGLSSLSKIKSNSKRPFIIRYKIEGEKYIQILNWHKHQKPHHTEKESIIPECPKTLLDTIEKGMESTKVNQLEASTELKNGEGTVKPLAKEKHLDFVYLFEDEHKKLVERYGQKQTETLIDRLNNAIGSKGYKYKSHYFTILNWANKDGTKKVVETPTRHNPNIPEGMTVKEAYDLKHKKKIDNLTTPIGKKV